MKTKTLKVERKALISAIQKTIETASWLKEGEACLYGKHDGKKILDFEVTVGEKENKDLILVYKREAFNALARADMSYELGQELLNNPQLAAVYATLYTGNEGSKCDFEVFKGLLPLKAQEIERKLVGYNAYLDAFEIVTYSYEYAQYASLIVK